MSTSKKSNRKYTIDDCHRVALNNGGTPCPPEVKVARAEARAKIIK